MFNMFPFLFGQTNNGNYNQLNNGYTYDIFNYLLSDEFITGLTNQILSDDSLISIPEQIFGENPYNIEFKDNGDFYSIKGYLPGLTAKDIKIDFEKNKAILTVKRKQVYTNNNMVAMFQCSEDFIKNFYIEEVDVTKLRASFNNNVLNLEIPKVKNINNSDQNVIVDVDNVVEVKNSAYTDGD